MFDLDDPGLRALLWLVIWCLLLLVGSLVSVARLIAGRSSRPRIGWSPVTTWQLSAPDFWLFLCLIAGWFAVSAQLVMQAARWLAVDTDTAAPWLTIGGGLVLQGGMLAIFVLWRAHHRQLTEGGLSPRPLSWWAASRSGFIWFLASLPVIYTVAGAWQFGLEAARRVTGWPLDLPLQDAVSLFLDVEQPAARIGLIILAVVVAPIVEELVFRAGIYRYLKGHLPRWLAIGVSSLLFGVVHGNIHGLPGLVAVGVMLAIAYEATANIRVPIIFHACFNLNSIVFILLTPSHLL
jgi:uncharacterized protein